MTTQADKPGRRQRLNGFDLFVMAGAAVNLLVVTYLFGYWLLFG